MAKSLRDLRSAYGFFKGCDMIATLVVLLTLMVVGVWPAWPHSRDWGYAPGGMLTLILIEVVLLTLWGPH